MRILLFYQYYHNPDCPATGRHYQLVKALGRRHDVHVITSDSWEQKRLAHEFDWTPPGVTLHRLPVPYDNAMTVRDRFTAYAAYARRAILSGLRVPRPDVVLGTSTPLTAAWAASVVARLRRVPWVFEVRDLWPDFPFQMGALPSPWVRKRLYTLERSLYRNAAHVVTLSPDMETHVLARGAADAVTTLVNGADLDYCAAVSDEDARALRVKHGLDGKNVVLYAGTFGRANAIGALIDTARALQHRADLHFAFLGEGYEAGRLRDAARSLPNVGVYPPEPRHRIYRWFRMADLSVVSFIDLPVLAANSPAKFFDSLAAGTPVLVTNAGWTKTFVERHACGWSVPAAEPAALVRGIERALGDPEALRRVGCNGQRIARQRFDRKVLMQRFEEILERVAGGS